MNCSAGQEELFVKITNHHSLLLKGEGDLCLLSLEEPLVPLSGKVDAVFHTGFYFVSRHLIKFGIQKTANCVSINIKEA